MHPRKSPFVFAMPCLLALALPAPVSAHEGRKPVPPTSVATDGETRDVIEVVDRFSAALKSGDMTTVSALLHPAVVVLESGGAERSRDEYFAHHAAADADFLRGAEVRPGPRSAHRRGELAWVAGESEVQWLRDGKPATSLNTETMVLQRGPQGWRIVHIHWSSRNKKESSP